MEKQMSKGPSRELAESIQCKPGLARVFVAEEDLALAARLNVPVLISGPPELSRQVANELDRRIGSPNGAVKIVDCRQAGALAEFLLIAEPKLTRGDDTRPKVVLLQEVQSLSADAQSRLASQFEEVRPPASTIRIVSSSSVPLFDQVIEHRFDDYLYYRLSIIHIFISTEAR